MSADMDLKRCTKCGQEFPATAEYWHKKRSGSGGLNSRCKDCSKELSRRHYEANKTKINRRARSWQSANPEKTREMKRRAVSRWRAANPDKEHEQTRRWRAANPDKVRENNQRYYINNAEKVKEQKRLWVVNNPEKHRVAHHRRRARILAAGGTFTANDIKVAYRSQQGKCWHCGKPLGDNYHVDHLYPLARGGSNAANNAVLSCPVCNLSKGSKTVIEWLGRLF